MVELTYQPERVSFAELLEHAEAGQCAQRVYATTDAQFAHARGRIGARAQRLEGEPRRAEDADQLYYLGRSPLRFLPLTPVQARQVNARLAPKVAGDPEACLSPRQRGLLATLLDVLGQRPEALRGLERPEELSALAEYERELRRRLAGSGR